MKFQFPIELYHYLQTLCYIVKFAVSSLFQPDKDSPPPLDDKEKAVGAPVTTPQPPASDADQAPPETPQQDTVPEEVPLQQEAVSVLQILAIFID